MRKKSKYKPKPVLLDALAHVRVSMKPLARVGDEVVKLKIRNHDALLLLTQGKATKESFNTLIEAGNMTEALAHQGFGNDWHDEICAGEDALFHVGRREKMVCKASELNAIREMMEIHDAQLDVVTVRHVELGNAHIREVKRNKLARVVG